MTTTSNTTLSDSEQRAVAVHLADVAELIEWARTSKHPGCNCRACKMRPRVVAALTRAAETERAIASRPDAHRWVRSAERLPERMMPVLAWVPDARIPVGGYAVTVGYHPRYGWAGMQPPGGFTHWRELCDPPTDVEGPST